MTNLCPQRTPLKKRKLNKSPNEMYFETRMQSSREICDIVQNGYEDHRDRLLNVHDPYHILLGGVRTHCNCPASNFLRQKKL